MDIQETQLESDEHSNSGPLSARLVKALAVWWKHLVGEFRKIGNDVTIGTVRNERFTHVAILRRLNHPDS